MSPGSSSSNPVNNEVYIADGDYIKDIEVNDLRNRYTLTKGSTQKMVNTHVIPTDAVRRRPCSRMLLCIAAKTVIVLFSVVEGSKLTWLQKSRSPLAHLLTSAA